MKRSTERSGIDRTNKNRIVKCPTCQRCVRSDTLNKHLKTHNPSKKCNYCKRFVRSDLLLRHETLCKDGVDETLCNREDCTWLESELESSSVKGCFRIYNIDIENSVDYDVILSNAAAKASAFLQNLVSIHPVKSQIVLDLEFYHDSYEGRDYANKIFRSIMEPVLVGDNINKYLARAKTYIKGQIELYERQGSGWQFYQFNKAWLEISKYSPLSGAGTVDIPKLVKYMKSVLNIKAPDNKCFLYCLLAKLYPVKDHPGRHTKYLMHKYSIDMGEVTFPVKISDISKIEVLNDLSISVFEWSVKDDSVIPIHRGLGVGQRIDLLYIRDDFTGHYLLIKNFNAFMRHRTKHRNSMHYCRQCLHGFTTEDILSEHLPLCKQGINQVTKMPIPGSVVHFAANYKQDKKLFAVYFDFECLTAPVSQQNNDTSKTKRYQLHIPCSFCIVTKSEFDDYEEETIVFSHGDPDKLVEKFLDELARVYEEMMDCYETHQCPINMSEKDEETFLSSTHCHICKRELDWVSETNYPVRDHDHSKKKNNFRGAACNTCNINFFNRTKKVPAFCHNLKSYDMNLFLLDLIKSSGRIHVIPENLEKFKAIFTDQFTFLDSFAFLSSSLDKLADDLKTSDIEAFKRLKHEFPSGHKSLTNKGVYFYDYASSFSVFKEDKLPPREAFYNRLKDENISDDDYKRAQNIYSQFKCRNLKDYMELYVKTDTVLLCGIFEHFRQLCLNYYELDPCHYVSLPGFTWDAMLKMTDVRLELISDIDKYTFLEQNIRGGVCTINHRYFKANNKYLDDFDPNEKASFIHYVDANNLYGASMSKPLPTGNFRWLSVEEISDLDISKLNADGEYAYILEVDLQYPKDLHEKHSDYPLAVERKAIQEKQLSDFNIKCLQNVQENFKSTTKLCPDLTNKIKYVLSLRNLQLCLSQGLELSCIHRVLVADQSPFLKTYIDFNSKKRQESKSKFSSDFFKLCNNAIYGKFIEDIRKRTNVSLIKDERKAEKAISKPQYKGFRVLDAEVTLVQSGKRIVVLNKPIACGFMVLENAKCIMGEFWYNVLKPRYGSDLKLLLSDTDSFIYAVYTDDGYEDLAALGDYMDLSGYNSKTPLGKFYNSDNRKVPGKFSDERPHEIIKEVIALKPKMYSLRTKTLLCPNIQKDRHSATVKGVSRSAKKKISHDDFMGVLKNQNATTCINRSIRSFNRTLYSIEVKKRSLFAYDDKKFILENGIDTLSYGHHSIDQYRI